MLGTRRPLPAPPEPSAAAVDLARRVATPLGLLVLPDHRATLLRLTLLPRLLDADPSGAPLAVPVRHAAWVGDHAERLHEAVVAADYPVVGSPDRLRERSVAGTTDAPADVLALAVRLLLAARGGNEMSRKVLLHVGTPKTGTSYVQDVLFRNQRTLLKHGILYPADRHDAHFLAALDLMRMPWGGLETEAIGAWDALAERVRGHDGTAIISHEILATASRSQVGRALGTLGDPADTEVHLVLSVRDLVRQIPAEWQENVKHRAGLSYASFLEQIRDPDRSSRIASWFWGVQEVPEILQRWAHDLPPERVHLITVPPPGGAPEVLWKRFSQALDLDGIDLDHDGGRANPSLGGARDRTHPPHQPDRQPRPAARALPAAGARAARPPDAVAAAHLAAARPAARPLPVGVRGGAELGRRRPRARLRRRRRHRRAAGAAPGGVERPGPTPRRRRWRARRSTPSGALLLDNARLRDTESRLEGELDESRRALERAYLRPTYRFREKAVRRLQASGVGRVLLKAYRVVRGRNSRSA